MKIAQIPDDTEIVPSASPLHLQAGSSIVLVLHGYNSFPGDMEFFSRELHNGGFSVSIPRLPGHGTNHRDFMQCRASDWIRKAVDSYLELKQNYRRVYIAGLSMGALLAILIASHFEVDGMLLLAPALKVKKKISLLAPFLSPFIKGLKRKGRDETDDPDRMILQQEYWSHYWLKPISQFHKVRRQALKSIHNISCPTKVYLGEKDATVPLRKVAKLFDGNPNIKDIEVFYDSGHVMTTDSERQSIAEKALAWFSELDRGL